MFRICALFSSFNISDFEVVVPSMRIGVCVVVVGTDIKAFCELAQFELIDKVLRQF